MIRALIHLFPSFETWLENTLGPFLPAVVALVDIVLIVLIAKLVAALLRKLAKRAFRRRVERSGNASHYSTLSRLFEHIISVVVWFFAVAAILAELGLSSTVYGMLATAGIGGIAIGLGAQSLIKDVISGGFLLAERQIALGDYVKLGDVTGTVEDINLRTTRLRAITGELHIVPNGSVTTVTNYSRGQNLAIVDVPVPYGSDAETVCAMLTETMEDYARDNADLAAAPEVLGVVSYAESAILIRIVARCRNLRHWATERGIRAAVLKAFDKNGISIPFNTVVLLHGDNAEEKA